MSNIKTALISVWDKTGIVDLANFLAENHIEIISTGGTKKILEENNINVTPVNEITQQNEVMNGRVKTLHPKIFGGILADRNNDSHMDDLLKMGGKAIDLVIVNLYPFKSEAIDKNLSLDKSIEYIDIGGPSMLRAAAKNHTNVIPLCHPEQYNDFMTSFNTNGGLINLNQRINYASTVFKLASNYNTDISNYFSKNDNSDRILLDLLKVDDLRYGENPHQKAQFYKEITKKTFNEHLILENKKLSYNNILDIDASLNCISEFSDPTCVIIKHNNPCGVATKKIYYKLLKNL